MREEVTDLYCSQPPGGDRDVSPPAAMLSIFTRSQEFYPKKKQTFTNNPASDRLSQRTLPAPSGVAAAAIAAAIAALLSAGYSVRSSCLSLCDTEASFPSSALSLPDEWLCLGDLPSSLFVSVWCRADPWRWEAKVVRGVGGHWDRWRVKYVLPRSVSSGSPSPPLARPAPAFHSNLMIMIFAQDDLCLHSVITHPAFLWSQLLEIDGP